MLCTKCHIDKPIEAFAKNRNKRGEPIRRNKCKACCNADNRAKKYWRNSNRRAEAPLDPYLQLVRNRVLLDEKDYKPMSLTEYTRTCELPFGAKI